MGAGSIVVGLIGLLIAGSILPQGGVYVAEKQFYSRSESFADQLIWMGQDDGQ